MAAQFGNSRAASCSGQETDALQLALQAAQLGAWEYDVATATVHASDSTDLLFGFAPAPGGRHIDEYFARFHPGDVHRVREIFVRSVSGKAPYVAEYRVCPPGGAERWLLARGETIRDSAGNPVRMRGAIIDITDRKQAERRAETAHAELREMLQHLQAIYDTAPVGLCVLDRELRYVRINTRLAEFNGIAAEAHIGKRIEEVVPSLAARTAPLLRRVVRTGRPVLGIEIEGETPGCPGVLRAWTESWLPLKDADGRVTGINVVSQEITDRKQAEKAIRENEHRLSLAQRAGRVGVFDWYIQKHTVVWTPELEEIFGLEPASFEGTMDAWAARIHPEDVEKLKPFFEEWLKSGREEARWEFRFFRPGGEVRWMEARGRLMFDASGRPYRIIGTNLDVTARVLTESELRQANEDLEQFAFSASHDLQEPLRTLTLYSQLVCRRFEGRLDAEGAELLGTIERASRRISALVRDLLTYSRTMSSPGAVTPAPASEALSIALFRLQPFIDATGGAITHEDLPVIPVNPAHLQQLFVNLVGNSLKYCRADTRPIVHIAATRLEHKWEFAIEDNGIGIAPEYHQKIFGLFKRLHGSEYSGTGLGLAMCKRIVERYGGRIWVESDGHNGTRFHFTLPA